MSHEVEIKLPKLGESIVSATVVQWFKKEGDVVKLDEPLLEVSTDKVNSEIPSPVAGKVGKILAAPDEELAVGAPLATILTNEGEKEEAPSSAQEKVEKKTETNGPSKKGFFTPVVLRLAQEKGIDLSELENIPATGAGGRLSKRDLEKYLHKRKAPTPSKGDERVKMSPMRKGVADAMVRSYTEIPHATLVAEVDVTDLMGHIQKTKAAFLQDNGYKLTITSYIAKAIAEGVRQFPFVNAVLDRDHIVVKQKVNLGIAVSVDQGILVPVIARCDALSVKEVAQEVAALSSKARSGTLSPDQVQEGTITMTNFGMSGILMGTPIIRQPEVAIIGVGAITKQVVVLEGNAMAIRSMMRLSLSFDHRVIDGMYGCGFLTAIKTYLESVC